MVSQGSPGGFRSFRALTTSLLPWKQRSPWPAPSVVSLFPWCTGSKTAASWETARPRSASGTMDSSSYSGQKRPFFFCCFLWNWLAQHYALLKYTYSRVNVDDIMDLILRADSYLIESLISGYVFRNVTKEVEGWYHCEASNQKESVTSQSALLLLAGTEQLHLHVTQILCCATTIISIYFASSRHCLRLFLLFYKTGPVFCG